MSRQFLRIGQVLMLLVLFAAGGGHWMLLQSLAWTHMLLSYSRDVPFVEAVANTFDGKHPCALCKKIEGAGKSSPTPGVARQDSQANFLVLPAVVVMIGNVASWEMEILPQRAARREESPEAPPPRGALV